MYLHTHAFMIPVKSASGVYTQLHLAGSRRRWSGCLEKTLQSSINTFHYVHSCTRAGTSQSPKPAHGVETSSCLVVRTAEVSSLPCTCLSIIHSLSSPINKRGFFTCSKGKQQHPSPCQPNHQPPTSMTPLWRARV